MDEKMNIYYLKTGWKGSCGTENQGYTDPGKQIIPG